MARKERYIKTKKYKGNTYYTVQFQYGDKHNKQTYSKTFNSADYDTPVQALNAACEHRDIKRAELATQGLPTYRMTVGEAYEESKRVYVRAEATVMTVDKCYNKYIKPKYENMPVSEIDDWLITSQLESLRTTCTDNVLKKILMIWNRICKVARGKKAIMINPASGIEVPQSSKHVSPRRQNFTDEEMELVIEELLKPTQSEVWNYNRVIIATMIKVARYTGLRPRELRGLRRKDLDFQNALLHIRPSEKQNVKNDNSIRSVPMNSIVKAELVALCTLSKFEYPFSFYDGELPTPAQINKVLHRVSTNTGVKGFHLYGMRHSFDSELVTSGVDPRTVMELMGHNSVQTTLATYARSTEEKRREAIEKVENGRKPS